MTPLQELIGSLWGLVPGQIPYLFVVWFVAVVAGAVRLCIDDYRGEQRTTTSELPFVLCTGLLLTAFVILSAARDTGLIAKDSIAGWLIGSLAITIPYIRSTKRSPG